MSNEVTAIDAGTSDVSQPRTKTKEPKDRRITQQNLRACKPVLDRTWSIFIFLSMAVVLIPIGVVCIIYGYRPVEVKQRYDQTCFPASANLADASNSDRELYIKQNAGNNASLTCDVTLEIKKDMKGPIYMYIEIQGMYQNHRRYVRSLSDVQLAAASGSASTGLCSPQEYFQGNKAQLINPCGLIAWSYFNDTYDFTLTRRDGADVSVGVPITADGIAYSSDVKNRFGDYTPQFFNPPGPDRGGATLLTSPKRDERFINWMRLSALPNFRKLWGKAYVDLKAGDIITVTVVNQYNTYAFDGKKSVVLGTTTWLGGRNNVLGLAYVVTGGAALVMAFVYTVVVIVKPRKFGDIGVLMK